jgi:hypothetical protein
MRVLNLTIQILLLLLPHKIPLRISRNPLPPRLEMLPIGVESRERMGFGIQHDLVERQEVVWAEEEVEVF